LTGSIGFYSRDEKYGWLSNFHRCIQTIDGKKYITNEHYYQSMKAINPEKAELIRQLPTPYMALKTGRSLPKGELRPDWDDPTNPLKLIIMERGLRAKFMNLDLRLKLIDTGKVYLYENSPTDSYWGGALPNSKNHLGNLIMKIRDEIRDKTCLDCSSAPKHSVCDPEYCFGCSIYNTTPDNEKMNNLGVK
jgi:N-glycosidase YbiA